MLARRCLDRYVLTVVVGAVHGGVHRSSGTCGYAQGRHGSEGGLEGICVILEKAPVNPLRGGRRRAGYCLQVKVLGDAARNSGPLPVAVGHSVVLGRHIGHVAVVKTNGDGMLGRRQVAGDDLRGLHLVSGRLIGIDQHGVGADGEHRREREHAVPVSISAA